MTLIQYQAALEIMAQFLATRGWDAQKRQHDVEDGHWMLAWIQEYRNATCPNCFESYVKNLLTRLENGSYLTGESIVNGVDHPWRPEFSHKVRVDAGLADPS